MTCAHYLAFASLLVNNTLDKTAIVGIANALRVHECYKIEQVPKGLMYDVRMMINTAHKDIVVTAMVFGDDNAPGTIKFWRFQ